MATTPDVRDAIIQIAQDVLFGLSITADERDLIEERRARRQANLAAARGLINSGDSAATSPAWSLA